MPLHSGHLKFSANFSPSVSSCFTALLSTTANLLLDSTESLLSLKQLAMEYREAVVFTTSYSKRSFLLKCYPFVCAVWRSPLIEAFKFVSCYFAKEVPSRQQTFGGVRRALE